MRRLPAATAASRQPAAETASTAQPPLPLDLAEGRPLSACRVVRRHGPFRLGAARCRCRRHRRGRRRRGEGRREEREGGGESEKMRGEEERMRR